MTMAELTPADRDELVLSCADIASRLSRRYSPTGRPDPDLEQAANVGLVAAASRYDPAQGPFRPYAVATALGELKKHLRSNGWLVGVPRRVQESTITIAKATEELEQVVGASPTPQQLADRTGLSVDDVLTARRASAGRFNTAEPTAGPEFDGAEATIDTIIDVRAAATTLDADARELLRLRFVEQLTQRQIADRLETSQPQVHRRLKRALAKMRHVLASEEPNRHE